MRRWHAGSSPMVMLHLCLVLILATSTVGVRANCLDTFLDVNPDGEALLCCDSRIPKTIPNKIDTANSTVRRIFLRDCSITGTIPILPRSLLHLDIAYNNLEGPVANAFGVDELTSLEVQHNSKVTGTLPADRLVQLTTLRRLHVGGSINLDGTIPASIAKLTLLKALGVTNSGVSGALPPLLSNTTTSIQLYNNLLSGTIPAAWGASLPLLNVLSLASNLLNGEIPTSLGNLPVLQDVSLSNNALTGSIPVTFAVGLISLRTLFLHNNKLLGKIPVGFGGLPDLSHIWLNGNKLTQQLPRDIFAGQALTDLRIHDNGLTGTLPSICTAVKLQYMDISRNRLSGRVPKQASALTSLVTMDLSYNAFTGSLPSELANIEGMASLGITGNRFHKPLPAWKRLASIIDPTDLDFVPDNSTCKSQNCSSGPDRCSTTYICCAVDELNCRTLVPLNGTVTSSPAAEPEAEGPSALHVFLILVAIISCGIFMWAVRAFIIARRERKAAPLNVMVMHTRKKTSMSSPASVASGSTPNGLIYLQASPSTDAQTSPMSDVLTSPSESFAMDIASDYEAMESPDLTDSAVVGSVDSFTMSSSVDSDDEEDDVSGDSGGDSGATMNAFVNEVTSPSSRWSSSPHVSGGGTAKVKRALPFVASAASRLARTTSL